MSQTHTHITSTQIECTSCKQSQIVERFRQFVETVPVPETQRVYGPASFTNRETISLITSDYFCEKCGAVFVPTEGNKLATDHDAREKLAHKYFEELTE